MIEHDRMPKNLMVSLRPPCLLIDRIVGLI